jgi:hypothetical protein
MNEKAHEILSFPIELMGKQKIILERTEKNYLL